MNRFTLLLALVVGAIGGAIWATHAAAFDFNSDNSTNSGGRAEYADPDDQPMPGMLQVAPDLQDYQGTASQLTPDQSGWIFSISPQR